MNLQVSTLTTLGDGKLMKNNLSVTRLIMGLFVYGVFSHTVSNSI